MDYRRIVVYDTGSILAGLPLRLAADNITVPGVVEEVKDRESRSLLSMMLSIGRLRIEKPGEAALIRAREIANKVGVLGRLSQTDLEVLALAVEKRGMGEILIATDDYALQRAAVWAGIGVVRIRYSGIREARRRRGGGSPPRGL